MLISGKTGQSCGILAGILMASVSVWAAETGGTPATQPTSSVGVLPQSIVLNSPPQAETTRSCVLYRRGGGGMRVASAEASDAAIVVKVREDQSAATWVVSAVLPAGYEHPGKKLEIVVQAELAEQPKTSGTEPGRYAQLTAEMEPKTQRHEVLRIPVRVLAARTITNSGWMRGPKAWIGRLLPVLEADLATGGNIHIAAREGKVTIVVFSAHWCGHCDHYMPPIEKIATEYVGQDVEFYGINNASGNGRGISEALERWGVSWPVGIDTKRTVAAQFGILAYPVIFVVNKHGEIEAVHGRHTNTRDHNGLDDIEQELRTEIDLLLAGKTRADFPLKETVSNRSLTTRPAAALRPATRPAQAAAVPTSRPTAG